MKGFKEDAADLRGRLRCNSFFLALETTVERKLLEGNRASSYTLREMASTSIRDEKVWAPFDFLSAQTHTLSMSSIDLSSRAEPVSRAWSKGAT